MGQGAALVIRKERGDACEATHRAGRRCGLGAPEPTSALADQSPRTLLIGTVLLVSVVSAVVGYVLTQYYSLDVISSLVSTPDDCILDWGPHLGRHCFGDYQLPLSWGMRPNPWAPYPLFFPPDYQPAHNNYPAAAMLPQMIFGLAGNWLHAPQLGLLGYLLALTIAVLTPAVWAARGARGVERVVVFVVCGAAAIPAWMVIDRGNSVALLAPIGLVFLVALRRERWGLVAIMVVLGGDGETAIRRAGCRVVRSPAMADGRLRRRRCRGVQHRRVSTVAARLSGHHHTIDPRRAELWCPSVGSRDAQRCLRQSAPVDPGWHQVLPNRLGENTGWLSRWSAIAGGICRSARHRRRRACPGPAHPACPDRNHVAGRRLALSRLGLSLLSGVCSAGRCARSSATPMVRLAQGFSTGLRPKGSAVARSASA